MAARSLVAVLLLCAAPALAQAPPYLLFESGPVRPVALSPNGQKLFVANIPDGFLEIFAVGPGGLLTHTGSVRVGLEPVAVAARNDSEVWVVNHLSDSVSVVNVAASPPRVKRTLLVGDEPRDIVFAGSPQRAFITTAHRGQHRTDVSITGVAGAGDPQLTTEGIGRADVWVFDAANPGSALGGLPVQILSFFADTPRALATDGTTVYVAAFHSGNRTTAINVNFLASFFPAVATSCGSSGQAIGVPGPPGVPAGIIVKRLGGVWADSLGCIWPPTIAPFTLPDRDVFAVNANTLAAGSIFSSVGTILFNMALNPVTGRLYVSNTEAQNMNRFEGPGILGGRTVQGHLAESRITVIDPVGLTVAPKHLNQHIDYDALHTDVGANHAAIEAQKPHSLATPLQVVVSNTPGDQKVYVAAFGSAKVGVIDASDLEDPNFATSFDPTTASAQYIATGGGPAGLALNAAGNRLYLLARFDQMVEVYSVGPVALGRVQRYRIPTPEPDSVIQGRRFLYDAVDTSGNGEASCASCHIFGDFDSLAWDLGNPDGVVTINPQPQVANGFAQDFHPMKGPMTTQTLRGLSTHGGMHWRGDRTNGFFGLDPCDGSSISNAACDEELSFKNFIVAFEGLLGKQGTLSTSDMQKFTDFALQLMLPPNPVAGIYGYPRTPEQEAGFQTYINLATDAFGTCNTCHTLDPAAGFFGADGRQSEEGEPQRFKVAHLRNAYQKVGMFGFLPTGATGEQVRGFGFLHDGSVDTLFNFLDLGPFTLSQTQSRELEQFLLAFPTDLAPAVGQQVTIGPGSPESCISPLCDSCGGSADNVCAQASTRFSVIYTRAGFLGQFTSFVLGGPGFMCDLVATTVMNGSARSYKHQGPGAFITFVPDDGGPAIQPNELLANAGTFPGHVGQDVHLLCAPPGSGHRMGVDRDVDGVLNALDNCPGFPNGPALGTCTSGPASLRGTRCTSLANCGVGGFCSLAQQDADSDGIGNACELSLLPEPDASTLLVLGAAALALLSRRRGRR